MHGRLRIEHLSCRYLPRAPRSEPDCIGRYYSLPWRPRRRARPSHSVKAKPATASWCYSDVGVITRAQAIIGVRMPEPDWARCVSMLVDSKLVRRKRVRGGISVLPNFIGIVLEREISG